MKRSDDLGVDGDFDIVQLEWTDSDEKSREPKQSEDSAKLPPIAQEKEKLRSSLLAAAMHAVVAGRQHNQDSQLG